MERCCRRPRRKCLAWGGLFVRTTRAEPRQGRADEGNEEEHHLRSISASVGPEPVGRSKHHGNEQSASCAIHYAPGLIHTARMPLMIVNAGMPLLNLHQAGTDAAGAQIPGSSAITPICDFRSANEITIGHSHVNSQARSDRRRPAGEQDQQLHDQIPLYFIAAPSTPATRPSAEWLFLEREADQDRMAHINGMLATSHPFGVSQE